LTKKTGKTTLEGGEGGSGEETGAEKGHHFFIEDDDLSLFLGKIG